MAYPGHCYNRNHLRTGQPSPFSSYMRGLDERLGLRPPESTTDTASAPSANTTSPPTPASARSSTLSPAAQATPALVQTQMSSHHERRPAPPVAFGPSTRTLAPQHPGAGEQAAHVASSAPALSSAFGHAAAPSASFEGPWVAARAATPSHQLTDSSSTNFYEGNNGRMNARPHYQAVPHSSAGNTRGAMSTPSSPMDPRMYSDDFNSVHGRASFDAVPNSTCRSRTEHSLQARRSSRPADMMAPSTLPPYPRLPTDFNFGQNYGYAAQPSGYGYPQSSTLNSSSIPRTLVPVSPSVAQYTYSSPATSASSISAADLSSGWPSRKRTRESVDAAVERNAKRARLGADTGDAAAMGSLSWHDDALSSPAFLLNRPPAAKGKGLTAKELELFHESVEWSISVYARYWIV